jgi:hypothetical protein
MDGIWMDILGFQEGAFVQAVQPAGSPAKQSEEPNLWKEAGAFGGDLDDLSEDGSTVRASWNLATAAPALR